MKGCLQPLLVLTEDKQSSAGAIKGLGMEGSGEENGGKTAWNKHVVARREGCRVCLSSLGNSIVP